MALTISFGEILEATDKLSLNEQQSLIEITQRGHNLDFLGRCPRLY
jgi:hypothetical protein